MKILWQYFSILVSYSLFYVSIILFYFLSIFFFFFPSFFLLHTRTLNFFFLYFLLSSSFLPLPPHMWPYFFSLFPSFVFFLTTSHSRTFHFSASLFFFYSLKATRIKEERRWWWWWRRRWRWLKHKEIPHLSP